MKKEKEEISNELLGKVSGGFNFSFSNIKDKILSIVKLYHGVYCEYCGKRFKVFVSSKGWENIKKEKEKTHKYFLCADCKAKYPSKSILP